MNDQKDKQDIIITDLEVHLAEKVKGGPGDTATFTITVTDDGAGPTSTTQGRGLFIVSTSPLRP